MWHIHTSNKQVKLTTILSINNRAMLTPHYILHNMTRFHYNKHMKYEYRFQYIFSIVYTTVGKSTYLPVT